MDEHYILRFPDKASVARGFTGKAPSGANPMFYLAKCVQLVRKVVIGRARGQRFEVVSRGTDA